jgi:hypothetical protein
VIEDDCEELAVSLYPAGGFSSITLVYEAAEAIAEETATRASRCISSTSAITTRLAC